MSDGVRVPLRLAFEEQAREPTRRPRFYEGRPYLQFTVDEDLSEGWYAFSVLRERSVVNTPLFRMLPRHKDFGAERFGARFRVGTGPVLRSVEVCDNTDPRINASPAPSLIFQVSEPVGLAVGGDPREAFRVLGSDGARRAQMALEGVDPSIIALNQRILASSATGNKRTYWSQFIAELPPDTFQLQISDALRAEADQPLRSLPADLEAVAARRGGARVEPMSGVSQQITWRTLPLVNGCHFWTP